MFLQASVILLTGEEYLTPPPDLEQTHPPEQTPPQPGTPPPTRYTPPGPGTPPGTRYTPQDQVHPPGPGTSPGPGTPPWDQVHPPRTRYPPPGPGTPLGPGTPPNQVHPPDAEHAGRYGQWAGGTHPTGMQSCIWQFLTLCFFSHFEFYFDRGTNQWIHLCSTARLWYIQLRGRFVYNCAEK